MSIVSHAHPFVIGVDTHVRNHVYAIVSAVTGELLDTGEFPTTSAGLNRAIAWAGRRTGSDLNTLWVIEGAATFGAILAGTLAGLCYPVAEAARMDAKNRHGIGKTDPIDAHRIAAAVLGLDDDRLRTPRLDEGIRAGLQVLVTAREAMSAERTQVNNSLTALLRAHDLGIDARKPLTAGQVKEASRWRTREEPLALSVARAEAVRSAGRVISLNADLAANHAEITEPGPGQVLFSFVRHWSRRPPDSDPNGAEQGWLVLVVESVHALSQRNTAATINQVAREIGIDQSGASRLVTNEVRTGCLALRPSEDDARRRQTLLTSAGHELLARAHAWQEHVFDRLAQGWSQQRRDDFQQAMTELIDHTHLLDLSSVTLVVDAP